MSLAPEGAPRLRGAKHALPISASTGLRKWTRAQANATHVGDSPTGRQKEKPSHASAGAFCLLARAQVRGNASASVREAWNLKLAFSSSQKSLTI
jgi:hypothetical protein